MTGGVAFGLSNGEVKHRAQLTGVRHHEHPWQRPKQAGRHPAPYLIAAGEQHHRPVEALRTGAQAQRRLVDHLGAVGGGAVTGGGPDVQPSGTTQPAPRSMETNVRGARSANRIDHGGIRMVCPISAPLDRTSLSSPVSASMASADRSQVEGRILGCHRLVEPSGAEVLAFNWSPPDDASGSGPHDAVHDPVTRYPAGL